MFAGLLQLIESVGNVMGLNSIEEIKNKLLTNDVDRQQQIALLTLQNQNIDSAREREVEMAKVNPIGNRPLYALIYTGLLIWVGMNVMMYFDSTLKDAVLSLDVLGIGGIFGYLVGKNN